MSKLKMFMCPSCKKCHEYQIDAESCHNQLPIAMSGNPYTKFQTVQVEIELSTYQPKDFYYLNSCNNLRSVPPRAKIVAIWEAPINDDGEVLMESY